MNINQTLLEIALKNGLDINNLQFPDCDIDPNNIKVIMINEVPSLNPEDGFYSKAAVSDYMRTTCGLFENAGVSVKNIHDILNMGIYVTTAVRF